MEGMTQVIDKAPATLQGSSRATKLVWSLSFYIHIYFLMSLYLSFTCGREDHF